MCKALGLGTFDAFIYVIFMKNPEKENTCCISYRGTFEFC